MSHTHELGCGCQEKSGNGEEKHGCCQGGCGHPQPELLITEQEVRYMLQLAQTPFLPIAQFVLRSSKSKHLELVALSSVYIEDRADSMKTVKDKAAILESLADKGLISLDYELPLENGNYTEYMESELFGHFVQTVEQGKKNEEFLFDIPYLELGSIALTALGQMAIKQGIWDVSR